MKCVGMSVSAAVADLRKRMEAIELKAKGKCWSTRASVWIVPTGIVFIYLVKSFPITFLLLPTCIIKQLPLDGDTLCVCSRGV